MKSNKISAKRTVPMAAAVGIVTGVGISIILTAALTSLVLNGRIGNNGEVVALFVIRGLSMLIGGLLGGMIAKEKYLQIVGIITLGYLVTLVGIGIVFFDGSFRNLLDGVISVLLGSVTSFLILQRPKRRRHSAVKFSR